MNKVYNRSRKIVYTKPTLEKRLRYLRWEVLRAQYLYYVLNAPQMGDTQFDRMFAKLKELELEAAGGDEKKIPGESPVVRVSGERASDYPWHIRIGRPPWWTPNLVRVYDRETKIRDIRLVDSNGKRRVI